MALKNYYELLEIPPTSTADEVKRAFRLQIARYHPDKVQHLGKEFQSMAADRAAELTEAYRVLSDAGRRAEYDYARAGSAHTAAPPAPAAASATSPRPESRSSSSPAPVPPPASASPFKHERATRDEFVRKATMTRLRQAFASMGGAYDEPEVRGFDVAWVPKGKLFGRGKGPRLLTRFVSRVDDAAVADAWTQAGRWNTASNEEVCVLLIGSAMSPAGELAAAIARQRRVTRGAKVTLIPVDARDWEAHIPTDAPELAKNLLSRLQKGG